LTHRANLDHNTALANFASELERAVIRTVQQGTMTADLARLSGTDPAGVSTEQFIDAVAANCSQQP
jgi:isocitrate dehydrogenase